MDKGKTKTGKYLLDKDIAWCRRYARFNERDLLGYKI